MVMMTDEQFIKSIRNKTIPFNNSQGYPVGSYLVVTNGQTGYQIYNRKLIKPLITTPFCSIIDAYNFSKKIIELYGDLLHILIDKNYAEVFFQITQYTVENGIMINQRIRSFDNLSQIKRADLAFILD